MSTVQSAVSSPVCTLSKVIKVYLEFLYNSLISPCVFLDSPVFSCFPLYSPLFPFIPLYSPVFLCIPLYPHVFSCIHLYSPVFSCIPLYSPVSSCILLQSPVYRIYSNKRRGAYLIFRTTSAALIRGRSLLKIAPDKFTFSIFLFNGALSIC